MDENDLLFTNQFVKNPELTGEIPEAFNDEFKNYYKNEMDKANEEKLRRSLDKISIRSIQLDEENDGSSILNTNKFSSESISGIDQQNIQRSTKEIKTFVSIDSRDRTKALYPKPSYFKIFLGKTFYNVKSIKLSSVEFPNTNAVINSNNNKIFWRNKEDIEDNIIDDTTGTYPVYSVDLRIGSYLATTLQTEITNSLSLIKRQNKTGDFHYFVVTLDLDTDIVNFTSLILQQLAVNPINVVSNSNTITINYPNHSYIVGTQVDIYIIGAKNISGIPASILNGSHLANVISDSVLSFEITIKASETAIGGGNTVQIGKKAPFQLLFGENSKTIAQNIGFPLENSSVKINNYIKNISNFYQAQIMTTTPHNFNNTSNFVGQICVLNNTTTTSPNIDGNRIISKIINSTTFLIQIPSELFGIVTDSGQVTFNGITLDISSISPITKNTVLVETFTKHNFDLNDVNKTLTFYNTISVPSFDNQNTLYSVISDTLFIIPGNILGSITPTKTYPVSTLGDGGVFDHNRVLNTTILKITNIIPGVFTRLIIPSHNLELGQQIKVYNLITSPSILARNTGVCTVTGILDVDTILIDFESLSFDPLSITNGNAYVALNIITVSFPYHGFNKITNITQPNISYNITSIINYDKNNDTVYDSYKITTSLPHYLEVDYRVTLHNTDSVPIINGSYTVIEKISSTEFIISQLNNQILSSDGTTGTITPKIVQITTQLNHGFSNGQTVTISKTNATVAGGNILDGGGYIVSVVSNDTFLIPFSNNLTSDGNYGIIGLNHDFYIYGSKDLGGIPDHVLNDVLYIVKDIIDENTFTFKANAFPSISTNSDLIDIYISSLFHGFAGDQNNTKNTLLNRSINLEGENYSFLCCPQLATMMNTGNVKNIFARISLDQSPGSMVFAYLSSPKEFNAAPLDKLNELEFSIVNYDGSYYEFNDLDYSFVLEITEIIDSTELFNYSSKRGMKYN
jgi:hypothetical protein